MRTSQLTANPVGDPVQAASISRDGRYLAYSDEGGLYLPDRHRRRLFPNTAGISHTIVSDLVPGQRSHDGRPERSVRQYKPLGSLASGESRA